MIRGNSIAAVCLLLLWGLAACGAGEVLNVPLKDAEERLLKGDVEFILAADISQLNELERFNAPALFYSGLLAAESSPSHGAALFTLALGSSSPLIQEAAAQKLVPLVLDGPDTALAEGVRRRFQGRDRIPAGSGSALKALELAASFALGRYAAVSKPAEGASPWEEVLYLAARLALAPKEGDAAAKALDGAAAELAGILFSAPTGDIDRWVFAQGGASPVSGFPERFGAAEYAALAGRLAGARSAYTEGLIHFKTMTGEGRELFFHYPELLGDLGRAFQFGGAGEEGIALFGEWDGLLEARTDIPPGVLGPVRYRLRYFAGRIERQRRRYAEAEALFTRALEAAPDAIQEDASMWYILDTALSRSGVRRDSFERDLLPLLRRFAPRWHDPFYFEDVLDRLSRLLAAGGQWKAFVEVFALLRGDAGGGIAAQYAYILGRAIEFGLLSSVGIGAPAEFFKFARDRASGALYYRALAASRLGTALVPFPLEAGEAASPGAPESGGEVPPDAAAPDQARAEFILGFFRFGAGRFAYSYLRDGMGELGAADLRALAGAFHQDGRWAEAMRVAAAYLYRPGYTPARRDMELFYPRAFADLVESGARESNIQAPLLYGLIRTESSFEADARSRAGAAGLTQLMPATAGEMAGRLSRRGGPNYAADGEPDLGDPETNIRLGAFYLRYLADYMENPLLAVLAYNGGMGRVRRWRAAESRLPADLFLETVEYPETRDYGRKVFSAAAAYGYLYYAMPAEAAFAGILK